jgi:hypothetical protein
LGSSEETLALSAGKLQYAVLHTTPIPLANISQTRPFKTNALY